MAAGGWSWSPDTVDVKLGNCRGVAIETYQTLRV